MMVGGYILDLQCEVQGCHESTRINAPNEGTARKQARSKGWTLRISKKECYCPDHKGASRDRI